MAASQGLPVSPLLAQEIGSNEAIEGVHEWEVADIIQVRRITAVAVSTSRNAVAFIVKQAFLSNNEVRYGAYSVDRGNPGIAHKLLESSYIGDIASRPGSDHWTVSAELGEGTQLYDISPHSPPTKLVENPSLAWAGTWEGVVGGLEVPHRVGILSFEWSPDGSLLWYSQLRSRNELEQADYLSHGIVYDDVTMGGSESIRNSPGFMLGTELHVFDTRSNSDRAVAFVPSYSATNIGMFSRSGGTAMWTYDSRFIFYSVVRPTENGNWEFEEWLVDANTGQSRRLPRQLEEQHAFPSPSDDTFFTLKRDVASGRMRLARLSADATVVKDYGPVQFSAIGPGEEHGVWTVGNRQIVMGAEFPVVDGLARLSGTDAVQKIQISRPGISLSHCSFANGGQSGACVAESTNQAPELVSISLSGRIHSLVRVNPRYDAVRALRYEHRQWTNRFGNTSDGYAVYPKNYSPGTRYPAIFVTHGDDARNQFARQTLQWDFPVQIYSGLGYFVVEVNEPKRSLGVRGYLQERVKESISRGVTDTQLAMGLDAVATMEAVATNLTKEGLIDDSKIGISGYSRGAEVVAYVMTQTKKFKVASMAEGAPSASIFWASRVGAEWERAIYGGSPYDSNPAVIANYQRFSPSFRASEFAGPLLQQVAMASIAGTFELNRLLKESRIPTELVFYPNESHLFWQPSHRADVMRRNIAWFNYWLLGKHDPDLVSRKELDTWVSMRSAWDSVAK
jgi:dipeptidyl aminopeptidase/acylaminoacyl peptidase